MPPWDLLDRVRGKGGLRSYIQQHPDFHYIEQEPEGMLVTWAWPTGAPSAGSGVANPDLDRQVDQALPLQTSVAMPPGVTPADAASPGGLATPRPDVF